MELSNTEKLARGRICLPLDGIENKKDLVRRVEDLSPVVGMFKVGKELFTYLGPQAVDIVQNYGSEVFLDLKYHDIPNTVKGAAKAAAAMEVYMFNVHALGGIKMMEAAVEGANNYGTKIPKILGVTILTSLDRKTMNEDLRISGEVEEQVLHLAMNSQKAGLDGIVCSAADLDYQRGKLKEGFLKTTPGVQGLNGAIGSDQQRVFTPGNAIRAGSDYLVVGRAITDPRTDEQKELNIPITVDMQVEAGYNIIKDVDIALQEVGVKN